MTGPRSLLLSRRDLEFLLYEWLDVELLTKRDRFADHSRETFDAVLDLAEQVATERFAPHNKTADEHEPTIVDGAVVLVPEVAGALAAFAGTGLFASSMDAAVGGLQLPAAVSSACFAYFQAANVATSSYPFLSIGNANLLLAHGTPEQVETYVLPMVQGRFLGTMALSEPQAGSSLADITTRAQPQGDGTYRLFGNKMWISAGEHELSENIVHLVLAKIPGGPGGVKGISLFVVPKVVVQTGERNDVVLAGLNHKMGHRGTTNTLLNFGEGAHTPGGAPGAVGFLVGEPNRGLTYMFSMMNEARVSVGASAMALGYTGYLKSLQYATQRQQGRAAAAAKDPSSPQLAIIEHADVRRMLLAQKSYVEGALALVLYAGQLLDHERTAATADERQRAHLLLDTLTPVIKSWPSQWCLAANDLAIQVHGGYGYTRDYDVEQHYRDNRLNPIHEGTYGIQGLDLLGRKAVQHDGDGLALLVATIRATADRATGGLAALGAQLRAAAERVQATTANLWRDGDPAVALANASVYLEAVGHVVVAWLWLEQALAAEGRHGDFYDGKRAAAQYFFRYELPRTGPQLDLLDSLDRTALDMPAGWFSPGLIGAASAGLPADTTSTRRHHMADIAATVEQLTGTVGQRRGPSGWLLVDQDRIDTFAEATGDHQWIHVDAERAKGGPFGTPIAHGYLTLSLVPVLAGPLLAVGGFTVGINYGSNRLRFPAVLPVGTRVRAWCTLLGAVEHPLGVLVTQQVEVEAEGLDQPVCVVEQLSLMFG